MGMNYKRRRLEIVTTEFKGCERCEGTGLDLNADVTIDCPICLGYGEIMVNKTKEVAYKDE